jgi:hypothetical protein
MTKEQWTKELQQTISSRRAGAPVATTPDQLGPLGLQEYRVQGGYLQTLLGRYMSQIWNERRALRILQLQPNPVVIVHGDMATLAVCAVLLGPDGIAGNGGTVAMLDEEYQTFLESHPEPKELDYHISTWSYFRDADPELLDSARKLGKTINPALRHRDHVTGTLWGPRCGMQSHSLWSWDGQALSLIEEALSQSRY